jgi:hypothetical protein
MDYVMSNSSKITPGATGINQSVASINYRERNGTCMETQTFTAPVFTCGANATCTISFGVKENHQSY